MLFTGTDTIIITKLLGLKTAGLYANYLTVANLIIAFMMIIRSSLVASIGNFIAEKKAAEIYLLFRKLLFVYIIIVFFCFGCFYLLINPFIHLWLGKGYTLPTSTVCIFSISCVFGVHGFMGLLDAFKWAAGLYTKDKFFYLLGSVVNIVLSVVLGLRFGINGILLATVAASCITVCSTVYVLARHLFKIHPLSLLATILLYVLLLAAPTFIASKITLPQVSGIGTFILVAFFVAAALLISMVLLNVWRWECRYYFSAVVIKIRKIFMKR